MRVLCRAKTDLPIAPWCNRAPTSGTVFGSSVAFGSKIPEMSCSASRKGGWRVVLRAWRLGDRHRGIPPVCDGPEFLFPCRLFRGTGWVSACPLASNRAELGKRPRRFARRYKPLLPKALDHVGRPGELHRSSLSAFAPLGEAVPGMLNKQIASQFGTTEGRSRSIAGALWRRWVRHLWRNS
jgi:hypothetical protein